METKQVTIEEYTGLQTAWCPGCGDFGILNAVKKALVDLNLPPYRVLFVSGIGQAGKLPHYTRGNIFNALHGRDVPVACAAKIANQELVVIAVGGDGDAYGEGGNHILHAMRRNHDITYLVHNNQVYGLTKGQTSPTSDSGYVTATSPHGAPHPLNPILLALAVGCSFVARGYAGEYVQLAGLIKAGIRHRGFALIDILQPCVTFNHKNTYAWYRERVYKLEETGHNSADRAAAMIKAEEWGDRIPIGIFYQTTAEPTFEERLPALERGALVSQPIEPQRVAALLDGFM